MICIYLIWELTKHLQIFISTQIGDNFNTYFIVLAALCEIY